MSDRSKTERQRNSRDTGSPRIRASTPTVADSNKAQVSTDTGIEVPKSIDQHKTDEQEIHELVHGERKIFTDLWRMYVKQNVSG